ncbi:hypothetical protein EON65_54095 [archaeon]|nr:MAG: hypothetical protein EON65_54095 [archaeon]
MDGLLCLWSLSRRHCTVLQRDNTHPISKLLADQRGPLAFAASYSGCVGEWCCGVWCIVYDV